MPLFDFDYAWDWDEFILAIPGQVPVLGKWYNRGRGQWFPYWGMTEEQLAATALIGGAIKTAWGTAVYGGISLYEFYSSARFVATSTRLAARYSAPVTVGYIGAHATHDVIEGAVTAGQEKPSWIPLPIWSLLWS